MKYKNNLEDTKEKWKNYWKRQNTGGPLMCVVARKPETEAAYQEVVASGRKVNSVICQGSDYTIPEDLMYKDMDDKYLNAERMVARYRHFCEIHIFLSESFPNINVDFGPGSLAGYVGSKIKFRDETVWFEKCVDSWEDFPKIVFDPENKWWKKHYQLVKDIRELAGVDFYIRIPDLMENIDVLASLRGTHDKIFDMMDEPEEIEERIKQVSDIYFEYYDRFYDLVKVDAESGSAYTVFQIMGSGKTAKLQCDFSTMMSPSNFRDFILEPLRAQAKKLNNVLYHLDGPDSIRHMDAIMEIEEIDALQWTSGDYGPDGTLEDWYVIYDKARAAGKSIWVKVYSGEFDDWVKNVDRIVQRYGSHCLFLMFPEMSLVQAETLISHAEEYWSDVDGTFKA